MTTSEWINIGAVAISPVIAVGVTLWYQSRREKRQAKIDLFFDLMAYRRADPPSREWVNALNKIDVVFQGRDSVRRAWRAYYDALNPKSPHFENANSFQLDLLSEIASVLGYKDLKQTEIDRAYSPQFFDTQMKNQHILHSELLRVLYNSKNCSEGFSKEEIENRIKEEAARGS